MLEVVMWNRDLTKGVINVIYSDAFKFGITSFLKPTFTLEGKVKNLSSLSPWYFSPEV